MKCYVHPSIDAVQTCSECGKGICDACTMEVNGKVLCRSCTEKLASTQAPVQQPMAPPVENTMGPTTPKKEPLLALVLSFFIPGLGHIYDGLYKKGIGLVVVAIFLGLFMTSSSSLSSTSSSSYALCTCIFFLGYLATWVYGMYDSYMVAQRLNKGEKIVDKFF